MFSFKVILNFASISQVFGLFWCLFSLDTTGVFKINVTPLVFLIVTSFASLDTNKAMGQLVANMTMTDFNR